MRGDALKPKKHVIRSWWVLSFVAISAMVLLVITVRLAWAGCGCGCGSGDCTGCSQLYCSEQDCGSEYTCSGDGTCRWCSVKESAPCGGATGCGYNSGNGCGGSGCADPVTACNDHCIKASPACAGAVACTCAADLGCNSTVCPLRCSLASNVCGGTRKCNCGLVNCHNTTLPGIRECDSADKDDVCKNAHDWGYCHHATTPACCGNCWKDGLGIPFGYGCLHPDHCTDDAPEYVADYWPDGKTVDNPVDCKPHCQHAHYGCTCTAVPMCYCTNASDPCGGKSGTQHPCCKCSDDRCATGHSCGDPNKPGNVACPSTFH